MKTDDLVAMLARGAGPVDSAVPRRRLARALAIGGVGALGAMLAGLGLNPLLGEAARTPMFWGKLVFAGLLVAGGIVALARLARPGAPLAGAPALLAGPVAALWALSLAALALAAPGERVGLLLGSTWAECPFNIALLALPAFVALLWALRGLAPTRLRAAGAAAGLVAGALAAFAYALHCPEHAAPFVAVWYVLGIALPAGLGALVGPRTLAW